jgi:hypothetical protein
MSQFSQTISPFEPKPKMRLGKKFESLKKLSQKTKAFQNQHSDEYSAQATPTGKIYDYQISDKSQTEKKAKKNKRYDYHLNVKIKVELYCKDDK